MPGHCHNIFLYQNCRQQLHKVNCKFGLKRNKRRMIEITHSTVYLKARHRVWEMNNRPETFQLQSILDPFKLQSAFSQCGSLVLELVANCLQQHYAHLSIRPSNIKRNERQKTQEALLLQNKSHQRSTLYRVWTYIFHTNPLKQIRLMLRIEAVF